MKTRLIASFVLLITSVLCAQSDIIPLFKKRSDDLINVGFKTGAKTLSISATGTLEWVSGATLTGASYFRTAAGLGIGVNVQAYDADLSTYAGITPSANVQTLLGAADYAAMRTQLGLGTMAVQNDSSVAISGGSISNLTSFSILNSGSGAHDFQINHNGTLTASHTLTFDLNNAERSISLSGNLTVSGAATISGTNTGDQTNISGTAAGLSATLAVASGGTGQTTLQASINALMAASGALSQGDVFYYNGTNVVRLAAGTNGQYLKTQGAGANPTWGTVASGLTIGSTPVSGGTSGRILFESAGVVQDSPFSVDAYNQLFLTASTYVGYPSGAAAINFYTYQAYAVFGNTTQLHSYGTHGLALDYFDASAQTFYIFGDASKYLSLSHNGTDGVISASSGKVKIDSPVSLGSGGTSHTKIKSGVAVLVAGTVTVSDSDVLETGTAATSSRILVTRMTDGGTLGTGYSITRINATSFTITSTSSAETSTLSWVIYNP
ncbi:MAG: hypothetical protein K9N47_05505 [Prosthecobacter sp.]|uniref:hypothetical protein n=1 Tax=Prosthecobacter sp. TaxID=1965333 RepID=UPI0025EE19C0|nr:hypothetical protein [Prosthecobacter sp.]MCF7785556.1 hypothetical protein [Prosthecobacter sp.]